MEKFWAMLLMPFYVLIVLTVIGIPVCWLISKLPNGRLKRLLLLKISG